MNLRTLTGPIAVGLALLSLPGAAAAQDDRGASVGGNVSAMNMESRTEVSFSGAFGYRFTKVVGLEIETTVVPTLKSTFPGVTTQSLTTDLPTVQILPAPSLANQNGRAVIFSNNVRVSIPTTSARLEPFFVAGGGIASVRHTADYTYPVAPIPIPLNGFVTPLPVFPVRTQQLQSSSTSMALTLGGGLGVRATSSMWIDVDLRLFRILGDEDQNAGRFGVGVRYRF